MATTVSYKGSTIATVSNQTKTLTTSGKYMEGNGNYLVIVSSIDPIDATTSVLQSQLLYITLQFPLLT